MTHYRYAEETFRSDFVQINRKPLSKPKPGISLHKRKVPFLRKPYIYHVAIISDGRDPEIVKDVRRCLTAVGYSCCNCCSDGQQLMKGTTELMHKSQWIVIVTSGCSDDTYIILIKTAVTTAMGRRQKCIISIVTEESFPEHFPRQLYMFLQVQVSSSSWKDQMLSFLEKRPTLLQDEGDQQGRQLVHRMMSFTNLPVKWLPRCMTSVGELKSTTNRTSVLPYMFGKTKTEDLPPLDNVGHTQNGQQEKDSGVGAVSSHGDNSEDIVKTNADSIKTSPHQNQAQANPENAKLPDITLQKQRSTFKMLEHDTDRCLIPSTVKIDHCALISTRRRPYLCSLPFIIPDGTPERGSWTRVTHPSPTKGVRMPTRHKPRLGSASAVQSWDKSSSIKNYAFESQRRLQVVTPRPVLFIYGLAKHYE